MECDVLCQTFRHEDNITGTSGTIQHWTCGHVNLDNRPRSPKRTLLNCLCPSFTLGALLRALPLTNQVLMYFTNITVAKQRWHVLSRTVITFSLMHWWHSINKKLLWLCVEPPFTKVVFVTLCAGGHVVFNSLSLMRQAYKTPLTVDLHSGVSQTTACQSQKSKKAVRYFMRHLSLLVLLLYFCKKMLHPLIIQQ